MKSIRTLTLTAALASIFCIATASSADDRRLSMLEQKVNRLELTVQELVVENRRLRKLLEGELYGPTSGEMTCEERLSDLAAKKANLDKLGFKAGHPDQKNVQRQIDRAQLECNSADR